MNVLEKKIVDLYLVKRLSFYHYGIPYLNLNLIEMQDFQN